MARLLYLVHRLPYPPDKGDKVRSFHLLRHLARRHEVHLGTFVDDPADGMHLPALRNWCADICAVPLAPWPARLRSMGALFSGQPLTLAHYRSTVLKDWVERCARLQPFDASVVFSSSMAPYALDISGTGPVLLDFVDMDSAKWAEYGRRRTWPLSAVFAREGRVLGAYERESARRAVRSYFVAAHERELFLRTAPDLGEKVRVIGNGVDAEHFDPAVDSPNPYGPDEQPVVFTGAMDYWPNVDAVTWFAQEMLPALAVRHPAVRFHIVGRSPTDAVRALAGPRVNVTGTVPDVRPYLRHAAVVVAPMRLARGIQNKVLEGMAMAAPLVVAESCVRALELRPGDGVQAAESAQDYVAAVDRFLSDSTHARQAGLLGRDCVTRRFSWESHLSALDEDLASALGGVSA